MGSLSYVQRFCRFAEASVIQNSEKCPQQDQIDISTTAQNRHDRHSPERIEHPPSAQNMGKAHENS